MSTLAMDFPGFSFLAFKRKELSDQGINEFYDKEIQDIQKPVSISRQVEEYHKLLIEAYNDCSEADWDGYGAQAVTENILYEAIRFIKQISAYTNKQINPSSSFEMPEIVVEPSGDIGFEWYKDKTHTFAASVDGRNTMSYAGIFGDNTVHGSEYFGSTIPKAIMDNLRRLYL